jgi:aspartate/methionine/tyrosine aminotransferase
MKSEYEVRRDLALGVLQAHGMASYSPAGAFYLLIDAQQPSAAFAKRLLDEQLVAVAPGDTFGANSSTHVRVAFATENSIIEEGVDRLCKAITASR